MITFGHPDFAQNVFIGRMPRTKGADDKTKDFTLFSLTNKELLQPFIFVEFPLFSITEGFSIVIEGAANINNQHFEKKTQHFVLVCYLANHLHNYTIHYCKYIWMFI